MSEVGKLRGSSPSRKPSVHHTVVGGGEGRTVWCTSGTAEQRCYVFVKGRLLRVAMRCCQGTVELVDREAGCVGPASGKIETSGKKKVRMAGEHWS